MTEGLPTGHNFPPDNVQFVRLGLTKSGWNLMLFFQLEKIIEDRTKGTILSSKSKLMVHVQWRRKEYQIFS